MELFTTKGIQKVTIQEIAQAASVSASSIYGLFKSKMGILRELLDEALSSEQFNKLVAEARESKSAARCLEISAKIGRQIYDAEKELLGLLNAAAALDKEFLDIVKDREERRYQRQKETVEALASEGVLCPDLTVGEARDVLWAYTGRDMYRLMVIERGWSSDRFEKWLSEQLKHALLG